MDPISDALGPDTLPQLWRALPVATTVLGIFSAGYLLHWWTMRDYIDHLKVCRGTKQLNGDEK